MPSQEFYAILELIIYPDEVDPDVLRENADRADQSAACAVRGGVPSINIDPN